MLIIKINAHWTCFLRQYLTPNIVILGQSQGLTQKWLGTVPMAQSAVALGKLLSPWRMNLFASSLILME